jgi:hypothetical protein
VSADTIVPGNASGGMAGVALKTLTVSFDEYGFNKRVNRENRFGPLHTLSDKEREQLGNTMGPQNPQALNRYSYVQNNPVKYVDPSGHETCYQGVGCGGVVVNNTNQSIWIIGSRVVASCAGMNSCSCKNGTCVQEGVVMELKPNERSDASGKDMADVDGIITSIDSDGNSFTYYGLNDAEISTVTNVPGGGTQITTDAKPGQRFAAEVGRALRRYQREYRHKLEYFTKVE